MGLGLILVADNIGRGFFRRFGVFTAHGQDAYEVLKDLNIIEETSELYVDSNSHKLFVI